MPKISLNDIVIKKKYARTRPSSEKMDECQTYYLRTKKLNRIITLNEENELIDGYIAYLVAKKFNIQKVEVVWKKEEKEIKVEKKEKRILIGDWFNNPVYVINEAKNSIIKVVNLHCGGDGQYFYYDHKHIARIVDEKFCFLDKDEALKEAEKMKAEYVEYLCRKVEELTDKREFEVKEYVN